MIGCGAGGGGIDGGGDGGCLAAATLNLKVRAPIASYVGGGKLYSLSSLLLFER